MFDCKEELSVEQLDKIKSIIKTDVFQNINSIIYICDLNQDEDNIIKNIKDYIWIYLSNRNEQKFSNKVDSFISFINNYPNIRKPSFILPSNDGKIIITTIILIIDPLASNVHIEPIISIFV